MSLLDILTWPDERLKEISVPVTEFDSALRELVNDLIDTMRAGPGGVGIAAPQTGHLLRVIIVDVSGRPDVEHHGLMVLVNPEITKWKGMVKGREGCLSVPDFTGKVIRAEKVTVKARDVNDVEKIYHLVGYEARAVQHEIDHLDGLLFLDRLVSRHADLIPRKK